MKKKLDMILDNQCMIIGMILKLDKDQELFDERDISMIDKQLEKIKRILQSNVFKTEIVLKVKEVDCFPNQNRPRVLFFKCEEKENNNLIKLQQIIGQALKHMNMEIDERVWQIHLSFARVKTPIKLPILL